MTQDLLIKHEEARKAYEDAETLLLLLQEQIRQEEVPRTWWAWFQDAFPWVPNHLTREFQVWVAFQPLPFLAGTAEEAEKALGGWVRANWSHLPDPQNVFGYSVRLTDKMGTDKIVTVYRDPEMTAVQARRAGLRLEARQRRVIGRKVQ